MNLKSAVYHETGHLVIAIVFKFEFIDSVPAVEIDEWLFPKTNIRNLEFKNLSLIRKFQCHCLLNAGAILEKDRLEKPLENGNDYDLDNISECDSSIKLPKVFLKILDLLSKLCCLVIFKVYKNQIDKIVKYIIINKNIDLNHAKSILYKQD